MVLLQECLAQDDVEVLLSQVFYSLEKDLGDVGTAEFAVEAVCVYVVAGHCVESVMFIKS